MGSETSGELPAPSPSPGSRFIWLLAWVLAAVYLVLFVVRFTGNVAAINWVSDYASGYALAETLVRTGSGGHTVISTTGAWAPLWFGLLTARLPLHRQLWEIAPTVLFLATAFTIGWSVAQLAGRREAALSILIVLVASPWALSFFIAPVAHNVVYPGTALLGAYLIWLTRSHQRRRPVTIAVALFSAVVLGVCIASDALLIVTGVIPFTIAALIAAARPNRETRQVALWALATALLAVPVAVITSAIMRAAGYVTEPPPFSLSPLSQLPGRARLLFDGLKKLSNGYLGTHWPGTFHSEIGIACDVVLVAGLLSLLGFGIRSGVRMWSARGDDPDNEQRDAGTLALGLHTIYWLSAALSVCCAFVFSALAGVGHESYYATTIFAVAAVVPLLIAHGRLTPWLIPIGACVFFLGSVVGLKRNYLQVTQPAISHYAGEITKLAAADHVRTGYAGYWDASSLTWNTHGRVVVRPLIQCVNPTGAAICPFIIMRTPSWYVAKPRRTFLLVDPNNQFVTTLPAGLGQPIASYNIGPIKMNIYSYDIASRLGPAAD